MFQSNIEVSEDQYQTEGDMYSLNVYSLYDDINLQSNTVYNVTVGAFNKHGRPVFSNSFVFKTKGNQTQ